ncbi:MAG: sodium:calcium antiporter [Methanobacteriota archaeon]|nr:MAG: sodium:calcium antiporter [Euryarchaeota archaeon]HIL68083.1 calcium/sodium antiporter [Candidatus Poseidoniales archaeon]
MDGTIVDILFILSGFAFLMGGGEALVQGATRISQNLSVSPLVVGFTVVAVGTSLPELAVVIEAISNDSPDIAVGGVLGSNVANFMLVLGAAAVMGAQSEGGEGVKRDSVAVIVATVFMSVFVFGGEVPMTGGLVMLTCLLAYYYYTYSRAIAGDDEYKFEDSWLPNNMSAAIPACLVGGGVIWLGAILLVDGSTNIAETYGVSEAVIGLTIVALGTSLPELAVTVVAGLRGQGGVALGNVLGSNVMNIMGIIGIASIFGDGIAVDSEFTRDIVVVIATSGFVVTVFLRGKEISKEVGSLMILTYLSYMTYLSGLLNGLV